MPKERSSPKVVKARAVMLRAVAMERLMKIAEKMSQEVKKETGVAMHIPYATILDGLITKEAKRIGVAA
jgi:hypothetical protein